MNKFNTHGGYFAPEGYLKIEEGGSHEENPNGGVQLGMDQQEIPNMLEQDESVYDDFVYSDNIVADKAMLEKYNLPTKYAGKKYSDIADIYVDEAENRPNDPISNNGLNAMLVRLADAQEEQKQVEQDAEIEQELANLSPEELAELEAMLGGEGQPAESVEPEMPIMRKGGPLNLFGNGGVGLSVYNIMKDREKQSDIEKLQKGTLGRDLVQQALYEEAVKDYTPKGVVRTPSKGDIFTSDYLHTTKPSGEKTVANPNAGKDAPTLPTWMRYAGAATSGLLGLHNLLQEPDRYSLPTYTPILPSARMHLIDPVYNPLDEEMIVNDILAQSAETDRAIRNSGIGPSTGALLLSSAYNTGKNLGSARAQVWDVNNQRRNAVISGINANRQALGTFDYNLSRDRASILNDAMLRNAQNNLMIQRLNNEAESAKYAAVSNQIDQVGQALSGIGKENFSANMVNTSNPNYKIGPDGKVYFVGKCGGTLLKKVKK